MKKTEGYIVKELEDEYIVLPVGERTEEVNEVISLSETAGFIYIHADQAEDIEGLAQMVGNEYGIEASEVYEDVKNVVKNLPGKRNSSVSLRVWLSADPAKNVVKRKQKGRTGSIKSHTEDRKR